MARRIKPSGSFIVKFADQTQDIVSEFSVAAASGPLGSVIHGLRIDIKLQADTTETLLSMGAADALQLAEAIQSAVHRREDVRR